MRPAVLFLLLASCPAAAAAQGATITAFYPAGAKSGSSVEVEIRGSGLAGAQRIVTTAPGLSGTVNAGDAKVDETNRPLWQNKCGSCHELRGFSNRSLNPAQWAATVRRMIDVRQAPINAAEADKIIAYLQSGARAGRLTAQINIDPKVLPGIYEVRVATPRGLSTAFPFEVGSLNDISGVNSSFADAQRVSLPCVANGGLFANAERHYYRFAAKSGERLVFDLKSHRFDSARQMYFNPNIRLYDSRGLEIAQSHGYFGLDPLIDWKVPSDGEYVLEVRDLLGRGNPGNIYRLRMGSVAYETAVRPAAVQTGTSAQLTVYGRNLAQPIDYSVTPAGLQPGIRPIPSPVGPNTVLVTTDPVYHMSVGAQTAARVPAVFSDALDSNDPKSISITGNGAYDVEVYASRLQSKTVPLVQILDAAGKVAAQGAGDIRFSVRLAEGQTYSLKVTRNSGEPSDTSVFAVSFRPQGPNVQLVARPCNPVLRPGMTTPVQVILTRRDGVSGYVTVTALDLPAGVTVKPCVLPPDNNTGWLLLTAANDAKSTDVPIRIVAQSEGNGGRSESLAVPQQEYRINNNPTYYDRHQAMLAVRGNTEVEARPAVSGPVAVAQREAVQVKLMLERKNGFSGPLQVQIVGLPGAWYGDPVNVAAGQTEVTLGIRPAGGNQFAFFNRDKSYPPWTAYLLATIDDYPFILGTITIVPPAKIEVDP